MNNAHTFSYFDALKYIGSKWSTELWQQKYTVISVIALACIDSAAGDADSELDKCNGIIDAQRETIARFKGVLKTFSETLKFFCTPPATPEILANIDKVCKKVHDGTFARIDKYIEEYKFESMNNLGEMHHHEL